MPIFRLVEDTVFPPADYADPSGLIAVGGDLSVGYRAHDQGGVHLFCVETVAAQVVGPDAVCVLTSG